MFFVEWWIVRRFVFSILLFFGSLLCATLVRRKRRLLRLPVQILSVPVALLGLLFVILNYAATGCRSYSNPIYSPDHKSAVRIMVADVGALGGSTDVELFTLHGFNTYTIFSGGSAAVKAEDVHWVSSSELVVQYFGTQYGGQDTSAVKVQCMPR
jgi:hypothetical protein